MDQLKPYLAQLKKHHFWVLTALIPLIALITWWKSAGQLDAMYVSQEQTIQSKDRELKQSNPAEWPPKSAEAVFRDATQKTQTRVLELWQKLYDRQAAVMQWPDEVKDAANVPLNEKIQQAMVEYYFSVVVPREFDRVFRRLGVRRQVARRDGRDRDKGSATYEGLVEWDKSKTDQLIARYRGPLPTTIRMRVTQEDIWLFDNLAWVIAKTNETSRDIADAAVKRVEQLDVAQYALGKQVTTSGPGTNAVGSGSSAPPPMAGGTGEAVTLTEDDKRLLSGRYLDQNGNPLADPVAKPFAEFKQVFVLMRLVVDQRKIQDLLVNCANAPLMIEPRQVNVFPVPEGQRGQQSGLAMIGAHDVIVEVRGVVYLYNPPKAEELGKGVAQLGAPRLLSVPKT